MKTTAILTFLLVLLAAGCQSTPDEVQPSPDKSVPVAVGPDPNFAGCQLACGTNEAYDETDIVAQPGAAVGDLVRCPVSGAVFRVDGERPQVEHGGATYHVCCAGCSRRFAQEPARFAIPSS